MPCSSPRNSHGTPKSQAQHLRGHSLLAFRRPPWPRGAGSPCDLSRDFPVDFPVDFQRFPVDFQGILPWISNGFPWILYGFPTDFRWISMDFVWIFCGFSSLPRFFIRPALGSPVKNHDHPDGRWWNDRLSERPQSPSGPSGHQALEQNERTWKHEWSSHIPSGWWFQPLSKILVTWDD